MFLTANSDSPCQSVQCTSGWNSLGSIIWSCMVNLFALRESRRGAWRQALGGSEAGRLGSSEGPICWSWKVLGCF